MLDKLSSAPKPPKQEKYCWRHSALKTIEHDYVVVRVRGYDIKKCGVCERDKLHRKELDKYEWQKEKALLSEFYIRHKLATNSKLKPHEFPKELVDVATTVEHIKRKVGHLKEANKREATANETPVKTCLTHGKLFANQVIKAGLENGIQRYKCRECQRASHRKHYSMHKLEICESSRAWKAANKDRANALNRKSWEKHYVKNLMRNAEYRAKNPGKERERKIRNYYKNKAELNDAYIKKIILGGHKNALKFKDIPQELIEAKRAVLQLKQNIKQQHIDPNQLREIDTDGKD